MALKQGLLQKRGRRFPVWQERWFELDQQALSYYRLLPNNGREFMGNIPLSEVTNVSFVNPPWFEIHLPARVFYLWCPDAQEAQEWVELLLHGSLLVTISCGRGTREQQF